MSTAPDTSVAPLGNTPAAPGLPAGKRIDEFHDYPRDQWDRPLIAVLDENGEPIPNPLVGQTDRFGTPIPWKSVAFQRASGAGDAIEWNGNLNSWKMRQAVIGLIARPDLFALAQAVEDPGGAGRSEIDKHIEQAQEVAGSSAAANLGTAGHAFSEKIDRGQVLPPLEEPFAGWVRTYRELTTGWRWSAIEERLVCREVGLAGRCDRLGSPPRWMIAPDGQIIGPDDSVAVDLKTSSSSRYFGVKFAVQLAVYAHGERYDPATGKSVPTGARRDWAMVVHIPTGGSSGALYWVNVTVGLELAHLAKRVLKERGRKDLVLAVDAHRTFDTLDEALAAGGVLLTPAAPEASTGGTWPMVADPFTVQMEAERTGESEQEVEQRLAQAADPTMAPAAYSPIVAQAGGSGFSPHPTAGQDPSDPANIPPDLGTRLQSGGDPAKRLELELAAVASATPRGGLAAVRERFAARWTDQHEAAAQLREWELTVITALEAALTVEALHTIATECSGWNRWTAEMSRVATRRADEINREQGDGS